MKYYKNIITIISSRILLLITLFITLIFSACSNAGETPKLYIDKAVLTKEEKDIAFLLGVGDNHHIYDFKADDGIQSIQVNTYELKNGEWNLLTGSNNNFNDTQGRLALSFSNLIDGLQVASLGENERSLLKHSTEVKEELGNMSQTTSMLTGKTNIIYEKEIPLVIQIMTTKNSIRSCTVESFYTPEVYTQLEYEHVLAVSILFSQKNVNELSIEKETN